MAIVKFLALLLLAMFALSMLQSTLALASTTQASLQQKRYGQGSVRSYQCPNRCSGRCKNVGHHHEACMFFCQKCCNKCLCVPPGTYGNKAMCPCYNNWKTKEGGPKCP